MSELPTGRAKGGAARAAKLTPEERRASALRMAEAKRRLAALPKVIKKGDDLDLAGISIPCAVIAGANGEPVRVITEHGITNALLGSRSGASKRIKRAEQEEGRAPLPLFLAPSQLKPFIDKHLGAGPLQVIEYVDGDRIVRGYDAEVLPTVCEIWLEARQMGALQDQQLKKAQQAEVLTRGLARVGIVALVDEATGFQRDREKNALAKILEAFVAKELQPYLKTFPAEYYQQLFRLYNLPYPPAGNKSWRPAFFGHITNEVVYSRIAPDLLPELKKAASKAERKAKLHQWLTQDVGHPKLREHLSSIVTIMKLSKSPQEFKNNVNAIHPRYGDTGQLDFGEPQ